MKKLSLGLLAAAALVAPAVGNDTAPAVPKPEVCPPVDASIAASSDLKPCTNDVTPTGVMTMVAVPDVAVPTDATTTADPTLMYATGGPVDDSAGPVRHQEGENLRDLVPIHTMNLGGGGGVAGLSIASQARFEGLTHNALGRNGTPPDRSFLGDRRTVQSMFFGKPKEPQGQTTLVANQRASMQKMAQIDKLRDQALATGDTKLMAKADAMESELKGEAKAKPAPKFSLFGRK